MPFGLKNAKKMYALETFYRMINKVFVEQIGKNMEAYIDDIIFKSEKPEEYVKDLEKVFHMLRKFRVKLNLKKCML